MFPINIRLTATLIFTLMLATVAAAQEPQPSPAPAAKEPDFVMEKGFKSKVFEVKNRDVRELANVIRPLGSGFRGATVISNDDFKTITVRDFPENLAAMEEALKRLDVALPPRTKSDIEFHIHILVASNGPAASSDLPEELNDVIKQMQGTLKYKSYDVMASTVQRTSEGSSGIGNNGVAESKLFNLNTPGGNPIFFRYNLMPISLRTSSTGEQTISIGVFQFSLRIPVNIGGQSAPIQYENVGFTTPVTLREGEKVVVGTTTMGDKGLIVVLSAKLLHK